MVYIAYIRSNKFIQNEERQKTIIESYCTQHQIPLENVRFFMDKATLKDKNWPQFEEMLDYIQEKDIVIVESFLRTSKSLIDLYKLIQNFTCKRVNFISIKEQLDFETIPGEIVLKAVSDVIDMKSTWLKERQYEGIERAKLQGKYKGRKPVPCPPNFKTLYFKYLNSTKKDKYTIQKFQEESGLKRTLFYRYFRLLKQEIADEQMKKFQPKKAEMDERFFNRNNNA